MAQRTNRVRRRALIVEDEPLFAMGLVADMHGLGFADCDLAADGQQAFLKATSKKPDIVLMDVNLDGRHDGIEAAGWLRCALWDIPIVFVTAYTDRDTVQRIHEQVPDAPVVAKPLYRECLAQAVAEVSEPR
jgi:two-component system, response regulator PdtaR